MEYLNNKNYDWNEININEVVVFIGCNYIVVKEGKYKARGITNDIYDTFEGAGEYIENIISKQTGEIWSFETVIDSSYLKLDIRKLSQQNQDLWRTI